MEKIGQENINKFYQVPYCLVNAARYFLYKSVIVLQFEFCRKVGITMIDNWIRVCMLIIVVGFQIGFLVFAIWHNRT